MSIKNHKVNNSYHKTIKNSDKTKDKFIASL